MAKCYTIDEKLILYEGIGICYVLDSPSRIVVGNYNDNQYIEFDEFEPPEDTNGFVHQAFWHERNNVLVKPNRLVNEYVLIYFKQGSFNGKKIKGLRTIISAGGDNLYLIPKGIMDQIRRK